MRENPERGVQSQNGPDPDGGKPGEDFVEEEEEEEEQRRVGELHLPEIAVFVPLSFFLFSLHKSAH